MKKTANIVLFDMDKTLVASDTVHLWAQYLDSKGLMTPRDWQKRLRFDQDYTANRLDVGASFEFDLSLFLKVPSQQRESWRNDFFEQHVKPKISSNGLQLIRHYKSQPNTLVVLITATHTFLAAPVAAHAQVHDLIATAEEIIDGEYTGKVIGAANIGPGKVINFQQWLKKNNIIPAHTILYSDSINDLPLLSEVTRPVAVDPDPMLRQIAVQRNWQIISLAKADEQGEIIAPILPVVSD